MTIDESSSDKPIGEISIRNTDRLLLPAGWHAQLEEMDYVQIIAKMEYEIRQMRDSKCRSNQISE